MDRDPPTTIDEVLGLKFFFFFSIFFFFFSFFFFNPDEAPILAIVSDEDHSDDIFDRFDDYLGISICLFFPFHLFFYFLFLPF